jgi:hypothetical protein
LSLAKWTELSPLALELKAEGRAEKGGTDDSRSLTAFVETLPEKELQERGYLPERLRGAGRRPSVHKRCKKQFSVAKVYQLSLKLKAFLIVGRKFEPCRGRHSKGLEIL